MLSVISSLEHRPVIFSARLSLRTHTKKNSDKKHSFVSLCIKYACGRIRDHKYSLKMTKIDAHFLRWLFWDGLLVVVQWPGAFPAPKEHQGHYNSLAFFSAVQQGYQELKHSKRLNHPFTLECIHFLWFWPEFFERYFCEHPLLI